VADDFEPLNPKLIDDVRSAIEDLTPTVSDYVGQSQDLAERHWNEHMIRMADAGAVGGAMAGQLISGYRFLAFKLVLELSAAKGVTPDAALRAIGKWTTQLEQP
jgi:hypothetical protein